MLSTIHRHESQVRGYVRSFPTVFERAKGAELWDTRGRRFIDLFAGAGVLNYGHNDEALREPLLRYLTSNGPTHALDMATRAKVELLETLDDVLLQPRGLRFKVQFPGPTGTNAVEAALKLARKVTGRRTVVSFTNGFHGMTLGSLAVTGNAEKRAGAGVPLTDSRAIPYDGYFGDGVDTVAHFEHLLSDPSSGVETPAAVILETVQAEGGVNVASVEWMQRLERVCRDRGILFVVDDIQVGCGRTGPFFSFERAGLTPDIVCLSKSLSGYGLPFALVLIRPELDAWSPGEHNGTFRGFNPAMVTATQALRTYWRDTTLSEDVARKAGLVRQRLRRMARSIGGEVRGLGLIQGLVCPEGLAEDVSRAAFERGVIVETAGAMSEVLKILPPLTIEDWLLEDALERLADALASARPAKAKRAPALAPVHAVAP